MNTVEPIRINSLRELDQLIAEKVLALKVVALDPASEWAEKDGLYAADIETAQEIEKEQAAGWYTDRLLKPYSTSIEAAFEVVLHFSDRGWSSQHTDLTPDQMRSRFSSDHHPWWVWYFIDTTEPQLDRFAGYGITPSIAICLSALKSVGVEVVCNF